MKTFFKNYFYNKFKYFFIFTSIILLLFFSLFFNSCILTPSKIINKNYKYDNKIIKFSAKINKIIYEESTLFYIYEVKDEDTKQEINYKFYVLSSLSYKIGDIVQIQGKLFFINENILNDEKVLNTEIEYFLSKFTSLNPNVVSFYSSKVKEILKKIHKNFKDYFFIISYGNYKGGSNM